MRTHFSEQVQAVQKKQSGRLLQKTIYQCYLLLGPANSGKSTLLLHSDLLVSTPPLTTDHEEAGAFSQWWLLQNDTLFIEPQSSFALPKGGRKTKSQAQLWDDFLKELNNLPKSFVIAGVILTLDVNWFFNHRGTQWTRLLPIVETQLQELTRALGTLPITLVITQTDHIHGFQVFFSEMNKEEREQTLGMALNPHAMQADRDAHFETQFQLLLERLNERLLWRLHHESQLEARSNCKDFPIAFEQIKMPLATLVQQLPTNYPALHGIYFTAITSSTTSYTPFKAFFIHQLLKNFCEASSIPVLGLPQKPIHWHYLLYPLALVAIISLSLFWHRSYRQNVETIQQIRQELRNPSVLPTDVQIDQWLPKLNELGKALSTLSEQENAWHRWLGLGQARDLTLQTETTYQHTLESVFYPYLDQQLHLQIQNHLPATVGAIYPALKIYLMMTQKLPLDAALVTAWFTGVWSTQFPNDLAKQKQLLQHLSAVLKNPSALPLDTHLVDTARQALQMTPKPDLVLALLSQQFPTEAAWPSVDDASKPSYLAANAPAENPLFFANHFDKIYDSLLPGLLESLEQSDPIIHPNTQNTSPLDPTTYENLLAQTRDRYIKAYIQYWTDLLNSVQLQPLDNFTDLNNQLNLLTDIHSPFWKWFKLVQKNTRGPHHQTVFDERIAPLFQAIQSLHAHQLEPLKNTLSLFNDYLKKITDAPEIDKACYGATALRMQNNGANDPLSQMSLQAKNLPAPLSNWVLSMNQGLWKLMLQKSRAYLNEAWKKALLPEYNQKMAGRYPLVAQAPQEVFLSDFGHFFGPNGTMDAFFAFYLKPFVDTTHFYWMWKKLDGQSLGIDQSTLEMFIRSSLIRRMFYPDGRTLQVKFELQIAGASDAVRTVALTVGNQTYSFVPNHRTPVLIQWPGTLVDNPAPTQLQLTLLGDTHAVLSQAGPWGWFKLLDTAQLKTTPNSKLYDVQFTVSGQHVRFTLQADQLVNPFIPGILTSFRCPETL